MFDFKRIKICFLAGTLGQGGAERQLFYMLRALREREAPVRLLCLTSGEFWEQKCKDLGVSVEWVGRSHNRIVRLSRIVSALLQERPDIVQSQHFFANPYVAAAARIVGSRSIGAIRSNTVSELQGENERVRSWGVRFCGTVAANSTPAIETAITAGIPAGKLKLLPNVVDTEEFRPSAAPAMEPFLRVAAVGRLVPEKRFDLLLRAIARTNGIRLYIAGDGPCREELQRQAETLGVESSVQFLGRQQDAAAVYRSADVLAIASDVEGTPNVALEAMACGLPVVSRRVGGVPHIIEHGVHGFLLDGADDQEMAEYLQHLAEDRELQRRLGMNAREHILRNYSAERLADHLENLYSAALAN